MPWAISNNAFEHVCKSRIHGNLGVGTNVWTYVTFRGICKGLPVISDEMLKEGSKDFPRIRDIVRTCKIYEILKLNEWINMKLCPVLILIWLASLMPQHLQVAAYISQRPCRGGFFRYFCIRWCWWRRGGSECRYVDNVLSRDRVLNDFRLLSRLRNV